MKKRPLIVLVSLGFAAALTLSSCDAILSIFGAALTVNGSVVNIKAATDSTTPFSSKDGSYSLTGTTVTFTNLKDGTKTYSATVGADGNYVTPVMANGDYRITASQTGWTFLPANFTVGGAFQSAPPLMAFPTSEAGTLTVVMTWANTAIDMDLHATWGAEASAGNTNGNHVLYSSPTATGTNFTIALDRDVTGVALTTKPLAETITLKATGAIDAAGDGGTTPSTNEFRFFVDCFTSGKTTTGDLNASSPVAPANVVVNIFKGTENWGTFSVPVNTVERTLRIAKAQFQGDSGNTFTVFTDTHTDGDNKYRGVGPVIGIPVSSAR